MEKQPCVYIMTNKRNGTLYAGVTSNIHKRVSEHVQGQVEGFTKRYHLHRLVYVEACENMFQAIEREKQIKAGSRKKKLELIEKENPSWNDLSEMI
ncbi:MAG: putative endonuclease [Patiriisocius sp.]|jgi:putative endonuclease